MKNPAITSGLKGFDSFERLDAYRKASKETLTNREDMQPYPYAQANRANNVMMCDECKGHCP